MDKTEEEKKVPRVTLHARVKIQTIAALAAWYTGRNLKPTSKSDLIHKSLETLLTILLTNNEIDYVPTPEEAMVYIDGLGITLSTEQLKKVAKNLSFDKEAVMQDEAQVGETTDIEETYEQEILAHLKTMKRV